LDNITKKNRIKSNTNIEDTWELVRDKEYITYTETKKALGIAKSNFKRSMRELIKRRKLIRIKRGFYIPKDSKINEFKLGNILFEGYIGLENAPYLHKIIDILHFTIYAMNTKSSKAYNFRNYTIKGIHIKKILEELHLSKEFLFPQNQEQFTNA